MRMIPLIFTALLCAGLYAGQYDVSRTFTANAAIANGARVAIVTSNGNIATAGAGANDIGIIMRAATGPGDPVGVLLPVPGHTMEMLTDAAIAVGVDVYPAAAGKVSATKSGQRIGVTLTASTSAKLKAEIMRLPQPAGAVVITAGGVEAVSTGVGGVKMSTTNTADNAAWIPITYNGTTYYVPAWSAFNP